MRNRITHTSAGEDAAFLADRRFHDNRGLVSADSAENDASRRHANRGADGGSSTVIGRSEHERLLYLARRDGLTGLLNHATTHQEISECLMEERNHQRLHTLMMIDLDNFKNVNDRYGHPAGDAVLAEMGKRLRALLRESDIVGRVGGDEFMAFLIDIGTPENVMKKARQINQLLNAPVYIADGTEIVIACSIGCALTDRAARDFDLLFKEADTALYYAKADGKNGYMIYHSDMTLASTLPTPIECEERADASEDGAFTRGKSVVLVADDSCVNRELVRAALDENEYTLLEAADGAAALDTLRGDTPVDLLVLDISMPKLDGYGVLKAVRTDAQLRELPVLITTVNDDDESQALAFEMGASDYMTKPFNARSIQVRVRSLLEKRRNQLLQIRSLTLKLRMEQQEQALKAAERDQLTGLYSADAFAREAARLIAGKTPGSYVLSCFDIDNFKVINDQFGRATGDRLLKHFSMTVRDTMEKIGGLCGRITGDNFTVVYPRALISEEALEALWKRACRLREPPVSVEMSIGRCLIDDLSLSIEDMRDRALLAKETIKGRYDRHCAEYDESMRSTMLKRQEIVSQMGEALRKEQFEVWLQPQYIHPSGRRVGAEALVRWRHPEKGLMSPALFIPIFEQNGFIYALDQFVWEKVCEMLRRELDAGRAPLPVSVNVSRYDIFQSDFYDRVCGLIETYDIPIELMRLEMTESAFSKSAEQIIAEVERLRARGFYVEIDDFGSGYSSLNILKDVPADILKLDIRFLATNVKTQRGGRILESVIRMAKWLDMPVIAEGVERREQADYLRTLGCECIQGFLYARPMPMEEYEKLPESVDRTRLKELDVAPYLGADTFWNPDSIETMVFNHFAGGAVVFEYWNGHFETLRINAKFAETFRSSLSEREILSREPFSTLGEEQRRHMIAVIERAFESGAAEPFELYSTLYSKPGEGEYIRCVIRLIASSGERFLFYGYVENVTAQRLAEEQVQKTTRLLSGIMDSIDSGVAAVTLRGGEIFPLFVNRRMYELLGYTREQFHDEGETIFSRVFPADQERVRNYAMRFFQDRNPVLFAMRAIRRGGGVVRLKCAVTPLSTEENTMLATLCEQD